MVVVKSPLMGAWIVILSGVVVALQIGKLPPALPELQAQMGVTWLQAGFLLSMVQFAGMALGLVVGLFADRWGLRLCMLCGLLALSVASVLGGLASTPEALLWLRGMEGFGFLLASLPAPALIRQLVPPDKLNAMMGLWGAYMPAGTALALLVGPLWIPVWGWPSWWWLFAGLSALMAMGLLVAVPADSIRRPLAGVFDFCHVLWPMAGRGWFFAFYLRASWFEWGLVGCFDRTGSGSEHFRQCGLWPVAAKRCFGRRVVVLWFFGDGIGRCVGLWCVDIGFAYLALCRCVVVLHVWRSGARHLVFSCAAFGAF
jgi:MFS family permease